MSLTQQQFEAYKGYRGDSCCRWCNWFGHIAHYCQYEERMEARELREESCENWWNALTSRIIRSKGKREAACSKRREAQQGTKCWGYGEAGHCYDLPWTGLLTSGDDGCH